MELTDKEKKVLNSFSMYIQSYGTKEVSTSIEIDYNGDVWEEFYGWSSKNVSVTIDTYDAINEVILSILDKTGVVENYFGDDETRGNITIFIDAKEKSIKFSADRYVTSVDNVGGEFSSEDLPNFVLEWIKKLRETESANHGIIHYEGSGDSGYMESDMIINGDRRFNYPENVENWLLEMITSFGDWYNNEGGQGDVHINFIKEIISIEGGLNYEDEEITQIPLVIHF
jgi:hypothetical protein